MYYEKGVTNGLDNVLKNQDDRLQRTFSQEFRLTQSQESSDMSRLNELLMTAVSFSQGDHGLLDRLALSQTQQVDRYAFRSQELTNSQDIDNYKSDVTAPMEQSDSFIAGFAQRVTPSLSQQPYCSLDLLDIAMRAQELIPITESTELIPLNEDSSSLSITATSTVKKREKRVKRTVIIQLLPELKRIGNIRIQKRRWKRHDKLVFQYRL